eukprot:13664735-Alexandrium_andersonii.AAC.1
MPGAPNRRASSSGRRRRRVLLRHQHGEAVGGVEVLGDATLGRGCPLPPGTAAATPECAGRGRAPGSRLRGIAAPHL